MVAIMSMNKLHNALSNSVRQCNKMRHLSAHELADRAFQLIIRDSIDNRIYKYFMFHGITSSHDLVQCTPRVVEDIVSNINAQSTRRIVLAYLRLITLHRTSGIRNSVTKFVENIITQNVAGAYNTNDGAELYRYSSYVTGAR